MTEQPEMTVADLTQDEIALATRCGISAEDFLSSKQAIIRMRREDRRRYDAMTAHFRQLYPQAYENKKE